MIDISIYMPVYNGEKFVKRCIDSILSQQFNGEFEFIIVDDGSEDRTVEIIEQYDDKRVKLFKCEHKGIVDASNFGLDHCSGKYIARMDCDDVMLPNSLQVRYDFLETHPEFGMVCGDAYQCKGNIKIKKFNRELEITHNMLLFNYLITHSCIMYRSELNLRYDKEYEYGEDVKLFLEYTYNGGRVYSLKDMLCEYHFHKDQICQKLMKTNRSMTKKVQNYYMKKQGGAVARLLDIIENGITKNNE